MADKNLNFRTTEIFWTKEDSDSGDNGLIPARGLKSEGNKRPKSKKTIKGKRPKEVAGTVAGRNGRPVVEEPPVKMKDTSITSQVTATSSKEDKKASLKDLCTDDKKRVANLIKELARLGEEKETISELLQNERDLFDDKINEVLNQQNHIVKEREDIESQLKECQALIEKYQQVLKEKEEAVIEVQKAKKLKGVHFMTSRPELYRYTPENAKGVPTRLRYDQEIEVERYSPIPKQHSSYITADDSSVRKKPHSLRNFPEALKKASTPTPDVKSSLYIPKPPSREAEGDRPFTSMIDKLIDDERNGSSGGIEDRELQLGPLVNPNFANLQKGSRSNIHSSSSDFQPLHSECATPSLFENGALQNRMDNGQLSTPVSRLVQPAGESQMTESSLLTQYLNSSIATAPIPEGLNDQEFLKQYRELNPEQRKQQLFLQKQALLQEQDRLKTILAEQETLLEMKQDQLRKQQDIQKERLSYFDRTGTFPPNFDYSELRNKPVPGHGQRMELPATYPGMPFMPLPHQVNQVLPPPVQNMAYNPGLPMQFGAAAVDPFTPVYMTGPLRQEGLVGAQNFSANKENHDVSTSTKQTRSACTSPMPSNYPTTVESGTSPLKSQLPPMGRASERQPYGKSTTGKNKGARDRLSVNKEHRIFKDYRDDRASNLLDLVDEVESLHNRSNTEPAESLRPYLSASRTEKPRQVSLDPFQDSLVEEEDSDLVDEPRLSLSGLLRGKPTQEPRVNGTGGGRGWGFPEGDMDRGRSRGGENPYWDMEESSDDLEESRVLEDVFFIK